MVELNRPATQTLTAQSSKPRPNNQPDLVAFCSRRPELECDPRLDLMPPHDMVHSASATWHSSASLQWLLQRLPVAVRLGSLVFGLVSAVLTLPELFSILIKVFEAVLEPYLTFIELLVN